MQHIAIMNKKMGYIDSIVKGSKKIESRWYKYRRDPWNNIKVGETVYFKDSGKPVTAYAIVSKVIQIEYLNKEKFKDIVNKYSKDIQMLDITYSTYYQSKNFVILIFLENAKYLESSFEIDKKGYGIGNAWLCIKDIHMIIK